MEIEKSFKEIKSLIDNARSEALKSVNTELIKLYWNIGTFISQRLSGAQWGEKAIDQLAAYLNTLGPDYKGFNRRNLYRMKQFYEAYAVNEIVSPLVTQLSWFRSSLQKLPSMLLNLPTSKPSPYGEGVDCGRVRSFSILTTISY